MVWFEIKKVLGRPSGKIALFLFVCVIILSFWTTVFGDEYGELVWVNEQGDAEYGFAAHQKLRKAQNEWAGELDEAHLESIIRELNRIAATPEYNSTEYNQRDIAFHWQMGVHPVRDMLYRTFSPGLQNFDYYLADTLSPSVAGKFYSQRVELLRSYLYEEDNEESARLSEREKEYLISQYEKLEGPIYYDYHRGWYQTLSNLTFIMLLGTLVVQLDGDEYDSKKDELIKRLSKGEKIFVISVYQTIGAGQNIQYPVPAQTLAELVKTNDFNHRGEKDFDAIYVDKPTHMIVQLDNNLAEEDFVRYLFQMEFLQQNAELSTMDVLLNIKKAFQCYSTQHASKAAFSNVYRKESVIRLSTRIIIQAIGRICRTNLKKTNIYLFADERVADDLDIHIADGRLLNPEFAKLIEAVIDKQTKDVETRSLENAASLTSVKVNTFITNLLREDWTEDRIQKWKDLRELVLSKPTMFATEVGRNFIAKNFYIRLPHQGNVLFYKQDGDYSDTTNLYIPMARPLNGLFEQIKLYGGICAMYYGWEPLRDVSRPGSLKYSAYLNAYIEDATDGSLTDNALERIQQSKPDFIFLYMVETDEKGGHKSGWMSDEYLRYVSTALDNVKRVYEACRQEYTIIVTADHGGHDRTHGTDLPEDTTIPQFFIGPSFKPGKELIGITILDLAPTIAQVMNIPADTEWEGKSVIA